MHYTEVAEKLSSDNRSLKSQVHQLEQWLASVQSFLGRHSEEAAEESTEEQMDIDTDYMEDKDIFESDLLGTSFRKSTANLLGHSDGRARGVYHGQAGGVSWAGNVPTSSEDSPRNSSKGSPKPRLSFGVSGTFVSSAMWNDEDSDEADDARQFAELRSPSSMRQPAGGEAASGAGVNSARGSEEVDLNLPHVSSLRKLFPLPASLSMPEREEAYKIAPPDTLKIDTTNEAGQRRIDAIYDRYVNKPSLAFLRLKFGLKALKTSWAHSVNEEALLRNYLVSVADQNYSAAHSSDQRVSKFNKQVAFLQSRVDELEASRDDVVDTYSDLRQSVDELTADLRQARAQYADLSVAMESVAGASEVLKSEKAVLSAQITNLQADFDELFYDRNNMVLNTKKLNLTMNELKLANEMLQGKLDQVMQRLSITVVQRDELVRQFIDNGKFEEDENGVETLNTGGDASGKSFYDSDLDSDQDDNGTIVSGLSRSLRRKSSYRSDSSERFIPWS